MKYIDEFRDERAARQLAVEIRRLTTKPWTIMEICGGQTHTIVKYGLEQLLPTEITLVHGPGCPVCVTPLALIDKAVAIARRSDVIFTSFGDMLRVPGSDSDLLSIKAAGGHVRMVYSPLDAVTMASKHPDKQVVFFAVGFETTAPANAMAVFEAKRQGLRNFSILCSQVLVPPAMRALLSSPTNRVQAFLAAGHVCTVMGYHEYLPLADEFRVPMVVTGFEPLDILEGVRLAVRQLESGSATVENEYSRSVTREGNVPAQRLLQEMFHVVDRQWRGIGMIPKSGLALRPEHADFDAELRFDVQSVTAEESPDCIAGLVLQGLKKPHECPVFGKACKPETPLGAPMVSSEGACAAYHAFGRLNLMPTP